MSEDNLASIGAVVTEFAASNELIIVPAVPDHDLGPEVSIDPSALDLRGFLQLAGAIGDGALYFLAEPFDPDDDPGLVNDAMAHLMEHKGQTGKVCLAFARKGHGLLHFWELRTAWYDEWQELVGSRPADQLRADDENRRMSRPS